MLDRGTSAGLASETEKPRALAAPWASRLIAAPPLERTTMSDPFTPDEPTAQASNSLNAEPDWLLPSLDVSNALFLAALAAPDRGEDTSVTGKRIWGMAARLRSAVTLASNDDNYFSVGLCRNGERSNHSYIRSLAVVLDDVGTKVPWSRITVDPSWVIETSPGNFQVGYLLEPGQDDRVWFVAVMKALASAGLTDPGCVDAVHWFRLPVGANTKHSPPWQTVIRLWEPMKRWTLDELMGLYGNAVTARTVTVGAVDQAGLLGDPKVAVDALHVFKPGGSADDRGRWIEITSMFRGAMGLGHPDAESIWTDWTNGFGTGHKKELGAVWRSFDGGVKWGFTKLVEEARREDASWKGWADVFDDTPGATADNDDPFEGLTPRQAGARPVHELEQEVCGNWPAVKEGLLDAWVHVKGEGFVSMDHPRDKGVSEREFDLIMGARSRTWALMKPSPKGEYVVEPSVTAWLKGPGGQGFRWLDARTWWAGHDRVFSWRGRWWLNSWTAPAVMTRGLPAAVDDLLVRPFLDVVEWQCRNERWAAGGGGSGRVVDRLLDGLALKLVEPGRRIGFGLVLFGEGGTGKTLVIAALKKVWEPNTVTVTPDNAASRFKARRAASDLLVHEETTTGASRWSRGEADEVLSTMKAWVGSGDEWVLVEDKSVVAAPVRFTGLVVLTTNDVNALHLPAGDRRWLVVDTGDDKLPPGLRDGLLAWLDRVECGSWLAAWLVARAGRLGAQERAALCGDCPVTVGKGEAVAAGQGVLDDWVDGMAARDGVLFERARELLRRANDGRMGFRVTTAALGKAMKRKGWRRWGVSAGAPSGSDMRFPDGTKDRVWIWAQGEEFARANRVAAGAVADAIAKRGGGMEFPEAEDDGPFGGNVVPLEGRGR